MELCLDICLKEMGLEYVDLFLAHWPFAEAPVSRAALETSKGGADDALYGILEKDDKPVIDWEHTSAPLAKIAGAYDRTDNLSDIRDNQLTSCSGKEGSFVPTWKALQELVKKGKTRTVGVSNFSISDIKDILPHATDIPISCNQIEVHPWLPQTELIEFGNEHGILTTCYSPFAGQKEDGATLLKDETVKKLAAKNNMDVGQLLQSWAVGRGTVPLGKSSTPSMLLDWKCS